MDHYKVISKTDKKLELRRNAGLYSYYYTYEEDGTRFTDLNKVKELAEKHKGKIFYVTEEWVEWRF
jgi:hypothetical protein